MALTPQMIVEALEVIGKASTAPEIVDQIKILYPSESLGNEPIASTRARLQENCPKSKQWNKRRNLFKRVTPVESREGVWALAAEDYPFQDDVAIFMAPEGQRILNLHIARERSQALVRRFKDQLKTYDCRICGFNFNAVYGQLGSEYIEAHHILPVAEAGERMTRVEDLIPVCSNCHRMIHRNGLLSPNELKQIVQSNGVEQ